MIPEKGILLLVDKPHGWTSFDVVKKLRNALKVKKIGHAGTLDPLATGLLLIGAGKMTKNLHELQGLDKSYEGIIGLGKTTPSYDLETEFENETETRHITNDMIDEVRRKFIGEQVQFPPAHSAIKVDGVRAYKKARNKEEVKLKGRTIQIRQFEITKIEMPEVYFQVNCSKGTYIRSLAHDFGKELEVGGYLKSLRRTEIGSFSVEKAHTPEEIIKKFSPQE